MYWKTLALGLVLACALGTQARALSFSAGNLIVTTDEQIFELASLSGEIVDELQLAGAVQPCFLPNGNLLVIDGASGALQVIDLETGGVVQIPLSGGATGFTFVPYRFEVLVRGTLADGDEIRNLFFAPFELALSPGTRQIILISDADSRLAAAFETETLVLFGFEAPDSGRRRLFQGSQVPSLESGLPLASLVLRVEGRPAELFAPVSASGSLHVAGGERILLGNVSASMLLNR